MRVLSELLIALVLSSVSAFAQSTSIGRVENSGACSITALNPQNTTYKLSCGKNGLTPAEAKELGQALSLIKGYDLKFDQLLDGIRALASQKESARVQIQQTCPQGFCNAGPVQAPQTILGRIDPPPRHLTTEQRAAAIAILRPLAGTPVDIDVLQVSREVEVFGSEIEDMFMAAGWRVQPIIGGSSSLTTDEGTFNGEGVICAASSGHRAEVALHSAMDAAGFPCRNKQLMTAVTNDAQPSITLTIGTRIIPE